MKSAIYPGSFDPVTMGHLDVIERSSRLVDHLIIGVLNNNTKTPLFSVDERVKISQEVTKDLPNVEIDSYDGLMIDYCREKKIHIVIRGLRAITDFEYELQIAQTNKELSHDSVDTVFLTTNLRYSYLSSSTVKEVAGYRGDVSECVPGFVQKLLYQKFGIDPENVRGENR